MDVLPSEEKISEAKPSKTPSSNLNWIFLVLVLAAILIVIVFLWNSKCFQTKELAKNSNSQSTQETKEAQVPPKQTDATTEKTLFTKEDLKKLKFEFQKGKAELTPESLEKIEKISELLQKESSIKLKIIGHSCDLGSSNFNQKISLSRAETIKNLLIQKNIDKSRISIEGRGEKEPVAPNDTEENRSKNRRVEFQILE